MARDCMKRSKASLPFGQMERVRLCLFDATIDELDAGFAGRVEGKRAGVGWHGGHCGYCSSCPTRKPTSKFSQYAASLIEVWIDESERRTWFLTEINRDLSLRERRSLCQLLSRQFYQSTLDGRASLIITVGPPKAPFGSRRLPGVLQLAESISKETIRRIVRLMAVPIRQSTHTRSKMHDGGRRNSAARSNTASSEKT